MIVHFFTDEPAKIPAVRALLEPRYDIVPRLLGGDTQISSNGVLMVHADLRKKIFVEQFGHILEKPSCISEKLFIVHRHIHHMVAQAYALGATAVASRPAEISAKLAQIEVAQKAQTGSAIAAPEVVGSAAAFASMFSAIQSGNPINLADAENATLHVIDGIGQNGLGAWLDNVRDHHEGTFQHCLLVTGVAVGFALAIGFTGSDVKRLGMAATLHDIGKAYIPLAVLDRPGRLDSGEEDIMRRHPVIGYELLKDIPGISSEILDGMRHHHEYLDGSGYPDALTAPDISDLVRLL